MRITLLTLIALALTGFITAPPAQAQRAPLPLGTVTNVSRLSSCPAGFFAGMTCFQARMSCLKTAEIGFTYEAKDRWQAGCAATLPNRKITPLLKGSFSTSSSRTPLNTPDKTPGSSGNLLKPAETYSGRSTEAPYEPDDCPSGHQG